MRLRWPWVHDLHPYPHIVNDSGGCACACFRCVMQTLTGSLRCVCARCNQDCTAIARLGSPAAVAQEKLTWPLTGKPASRWYRRGY